jgi:hypothetical protein
VHEYINAKLLGLYNTPKKGSWLNMAEIELSAQCLDRRISNMKWLADEIGAWERERNAIGTTVRWRFNKDNARMKLQRHYSNLQN